MKPLVIYVGDREFSRKLDREMLDNPDKFTDRLNVTVAPEIFHKIFTRARLSLLAALEKNPKSINELAGILCRPRESVSADLSYLRAMGIIEFERHGKQKMPIRPAEISIAV